MSMSHVVTLTKTNDFCALMSFTTIPTTVYFASIILHIYPIHVHFSVIMTMTDD